jgi:pilus assembly protein CpaB
MRRGGRLLLLVGIVIALAAAGLLFFYLNQLGTVGSDGGPAGQVTAIPTVEPDVPVVVASVDIPAGTVISNTEQLELSAIPAPEYNANRSNYLVNISDAINKLTISDIAAGDQVRKDNLTDPGLSQQIPPPEEGRARDKAIAFKVDALIAVADQIKERDFVDVVASFTVSRRVSLPGTIAPGPDGGPAVETRLFEPTDLVTTKTLIQRAQVMRIVRPPAPPPSEGEQAQPQAAQPPPPDATPAVDAEGRPVTAQPAPQNTTLTQGEWVLVLLVDDQEAELLDFARNSNAKISLVLRGAGDTTFETTTGATLDLLIGQYGLPVPDPVQPYSYGRNVLDPNPTSTPAPTRVP